MALRPQPLGAMPEQTAQVARAAFPKGNPYLARRDHLGTIFQDDDFAALFPAGGYPGLPPGRFALVTIRQFREHLADRQAAEAVRARIDWKYLLGLALMDPGFDFSVLSEFRDRLRAGRAAARLLAKLLECCRTHSLLKARGQLRTDATHVLAAIRVLNRLELVAETLRAALNALATVAPTWLQGVAPLEWYERYSTRIEETRLPPGQAQRDAYAQLVGEDGFALLDALEAPAAPAHVRDLPRITALRRTWQRHDERTPEASPGEPGPMRRVCFKENRDLPRAAAGIASPDDVDARYRHKHGTSWTGSMVHVSATCEPTHPPLLTHVHTTSAAVHEASCTEDIHQALVDKDLAPTEHLVDGASMDAARLLTSQQAQGITLRGPTRPIQGWQTHVEGAYTVAHFTVDWQHQTVVCPQGTPSRSWHELVARDGHPYMIVSCSPQQCRPCPVRPFCTQSRQQGRRLRLPPQAPYEALQTARAWYTSDEGQQHDKRRAGGEGTLSQGVRAFGLRRTRSRGLDKTPLHHVATAAAINVDRIVAWLEERPRAQTRTSRFAALAPGHAMTAEPPSV